MAIKNLKGLGKFDKPTPQQTKTVTKVEPDVQLLSEESAIAPYETIFDDFHVEAYPFYNFWVPDERKNGSEERGLRDLEDIPRFIKVTWVRAPDLQSGDNQRLNPPSVSTRSGNSKLGMHSKNGYSFLTKGIAFNPEHLNKNNFSLIRSSIANGYITPGVLEAVVEMPLHNTVIDSHRTHAKTSHIHHIDEDSFLTNNSMKGISLHELKANVVQMTNGVVNSAKISKKSKGDKKLFDGKFSVARSPFAGGNMQIDGVHSSSPSISMTSRTAVSVHGEPRDQVIENVRKVVEPASTAGLKRSASNKVKFAHPVVAGVLNKKKVNMLTRPEHAESTVAVAQMLPQLNALASSGVREEKKNVEVPSFASPPGLKPVEYVGYILEKYRRNSSGVFEKVADIEITDVYQTDYIDTKVVYGDVYRYRIRSIVRWTRPSAIGPLGKEPWQLSQNGSQTSSTAPFKSSYFVGEWSRDWAYATVIDTTPPPPPDELSIRVESHRKRVYVSFKLPHNPQRDISAMRLLRKTQSASGQDLTQWEVLNEYGSVSSPIEFAPQNVLYVDEDVDFFQKNKVRYIYAAQAMTRHGEESTLSDQLACRLNYEWKVKGEYPIDFVSCSGVKPEHFGAFATIPLRRTQSEVIATPKLVDSRLTADVKFSGRSAIGNATLDSKDYVLRIESLDTGEHRDIDLSVSFTNLPDEKRNINTDVYVPMHNQSTKNASSFGKSEEDKRRERRSKNERNVPPRR